MIQLLSQERRKRCQQIAETHQYIVQRAVGVALVAIILRLPEAAAATADVPVAGVIEERQNWAECIRDIVGIHITFNFCHQLMQPTNNPAIQRVGQLAKWISQLTIKLPAIYFSVHGKEIIHIPNHRQLARHIAHILIVQRKVLAIE